MSADRSLYWIIAKAALLFSVACWIFVLIAILPFRHGLPQSETVMGFLTLVATIVVPDGLTAWWIFRRLRAMRSLHDAKGAAIAFGLVAPIVLGMSNVLSVVVGGYAETRFGPFFILPSIVFFVATLMIIVVPGVVLWAVPRFGVRYMTD